MLACLTHHLVDRTTVHVDAHVNAHKEVEKLCAYN